MQERDRSKRSMVFYFDWFDNFDGLEPDEVTDLLTAIRVYAQYGEHIDGINRVSARILKTMESRIDADFESWLKTANAKRENGMKGGRPPKKAESKETYNNLQEPNRFLKNQVAPNSPYKNLQEPVYEYDTEYDNDSVSEYNSETESEKEKVFEEDIGKGVQGENQQGETLEEKSDTPYRLSPADAFLLRHKDDANSDFVMLCYNSMKDRERTAYFN